MADVNITSSPTLDGNNVGVVASNNPSWFVLDTDSIGVESQAVANFDVSGPTVSVDAELVINGITYTAADDPGNREFLTTTSSTLAEVAQSIVHMLQDDPEINYKYFFEVNTSTAVVSLVAKLPGSEFDITLTLPTGITLVINTAGVDGFRGQLYPDYKIWATIYVNRALGFAQFTGTPTGVAGNENIAFKELSFDSSNEHFFDIVGPVNPDCQYTKPELTAGFNDYQSATTAFWVEYGEKYTPTGMNNTRRFVVGRSPMYYALNAKLGHDIDNDLSAYYGLSGQPYLTDQPNNRLTRLTDRNFLYLLWYQAGSADQLGAQIVCNFYDGSTYTIPTYQFVAVATEGLNGFRVDPESWGYAAVESSQAKLIKSYEVTVYEDSGIFGGSPSQVTETKTFVIDRRATDADATRFIWAEGKGGFAGFSFIGTTEAKPARSIQTYKRSLPQGTVTKADPNTMVGDREYLPTFISNSGIVPRATYEWLRDSLAESPMVYYFDGTELVAVVVTTINADDQDIDSSLNLEITWQYAIENNVIRN